MQRALRRFLAIHEISSRPSFTRLLGQLNKRRHPGLDAFHSRTVVLFILSLPFSVHLARLAKESQTWIGIDCNREPRIKVFALA